MRTFKGIMRAVKDGQLNDQPFSIHDACFVGTDDAFLHYAHLEVAKLAGICPLEIHAKVVNSDKDDYVVVTRIEGKDVYGEIVSPHDCATQDATFSTKDYNDLLDTLQHTFNCWVQMAAKVRNAEIIKTIGAQSADRDPTFDINQLQPIAMGRTPEADGAPITAGTERPTIFNLQGSEESD